MAMTASIFVLIYFALVGWLCELNIIELHGEFLGKSLSGPWSLLTKFYAKIKEFFRKDIFAEENIK